MLASLIYLQRVSKNRAMFVWLLLRNFPKDNLLSLKDKSFLAMIRDL